MDATIYIDGAARGNPGPAAYAFIIRRASGESTEMNGTLGVQTNNFAEYTALIQAMERAKAMGLKRIAIISDSALLVNQMNGAYRVKSQTLRELHERARDLSSAFQAVSFRHVRREGNREADRLCNLALDNAEPVETNRLGQLPGSLQAEQATPEPWESRVLDCLDEAAAAWAQNGPGEPSTRDVWNQLRDILEKSGVLRNGTARRATGRPGSSRTTQIDVDDQDH